MFITLWFEHDVISGTQVIRNFLQQIGHYLANNFSNVDCQLFYFSLADKGHRKKLNELKSTRVSLVAD